MDAPLGTQQTQPHLHGIKPTTIANLPIVITHPLLHSALRLLCRISTRLSTTDLQVWDLPDHTRAPWKRSEQGLLAARLEWHRSRSA